MPSEQAGNDAFKVRLRGSHVALSTWLREPNLTLPALLPFSCGKDTFEGRFKGRDVAAVTALLCEPAISLPATRLS